MMSLNSPCRLRYQDALIGIKPMAALDEIKLGRLSEDCAGLLKQIGLNEENAAAVGHNAAIVQLATDMGFANPQSVLETLSLAQLADIARLVLEVQEGTLEGDATDDT